MQEYMSNAGQEGVLLVSFGTIAKLGIASNVVRAMPTQLPYQVSHLTCHRMQTMSELERCVNPGLQQSQRLANLLAELPFKILWKLEDQEVARLDLGNNTKVLILFCCSLARCMPCLSPKCLQ